MQSFATERSSEAAQEIASPPPTSALTPAAAVSAQNSPVRRKASGTGIGGIAFAIVMAAFWVGAASAYLFGYLGLARMAALDLQSIALFIVAVFIPPMLFIAAAWALAHGQALGNTVRIFGAQVDRLFAADEVSARTAARLGRAVRSEIDGLNAGIDAAFARLQALEGVLQTQITAMDDAGARADLRGEAITARLQSERERIDALGAALLDAANRSGEIIVERTGQFHQTLKSASGALDAAASQSGERLAAHAAELRTQIVSAGDSLNNSAADAADILSSRANQLREAIDAAGHNLDQGASGLDALVTAQSTRFRESVGGVRQDLLDGAGQAEALLAKRTEELRDVIASASQSLIDGAVNANAIAADHAETLKATIMSAGNALVGGADQAEARLVKRTDDLRALIASSGETFVTNAQQAEALLAKRAEALAQAGAAAGETILSGAARVGDTLAERAGKLQSAIQAAENSLSEKLAGAEESLAGRATAMSGAIAAAEASLLQATAAAGEQLTGHATRLSANIEKAGSGLIQSAERAGESVGAHAAQWKTSIEASETSLLSAAGRASEILAGRAAQIKTTIESVDGSLQNAAAALDMQAGNFRTATAKAGEAPQKAALQLDEQAKKIETLVDTAMARTELVLGRQEKHRAAMHALLQKLTDESAAFDSALSNQRTAMEKAVAALEPETKRFETLAADTERHLELIMGNVSVRAANIADSMERDAARLKEIGDAATVTLGKLTDSLREASVNAHSLIGAAATEAKTNANALVGEAMAECEKLIRAAGELSAQSGQVRSALGETVDQIRTHLASIPQLAQQEAQRVRNVVRNETNEMLDMSARTIAAAHNRSAGQANGRLQNGHAADGNGRADELGSDNLLRRARKLTQRAKPKPAPEPKPSTASNGKGWEMSALLAAAAGDDDPLEKDLKPRDASALGTLEATLSDMAMDLTAIELAPGPGEEEWRSYLAGDRAVFARRLANSIDSDAVNRITNLYRENTPFRQAADKYIGEFEALLHKAREGDNNGLLTSTMLGADTGKIYLALSYGLGRLS